MNKASKEPPPPPPRPQRTPLNFLIPVGKIIGFYLHTHSSLSYSHSLISENAIPANPLIISCRLPSATAASPLLDLTRSQPQGAKKGFVTAVSSLLLNLVRVIHCVWREMGSPIKHRISHLPAPPASPTPSFSCSLEQSSSCCPVVAISPCSVLRDV